MRLHPRLQAGLIPVAAVYDLPSPQGDGPPQAPLTDALHQRLELGWWDLGIQQCQFTEGISCIARRQCILLYRGSQAGECSGSDYRCPPYSATWQWGWDCGIGPPLSPRTGWHDRGWQCKFALSPPTRLQARPVAEVPYRRVHATPGDSVRVGGRTDCR